MRNTLIASAIMIAKELQRVDTPTIQTPVINVTVAGQFILNLFDPNNNASMTTSKSIITKNTESVASIKKSEYDAANTDYLSGLPILNTSNSIVLKFSIEKFSLLFVKYAKALSKFLTRYLRTSFCMEFDNIEFLEFNQYIRSHDESAVFGLFEINLVPAIVELSGNVANLMIDRVLGAQKITEKTKEFSDIDLILIERLLNQSLSYLTASDTHFLKQT